MRILGIDPGLTGGMAVLVTGNDLDGPARIAGVSDLPVTGEAARRRIDVLAVNTWIRAHTPDIAFIERAGAMPRQGSASGFIYGRAVGALEAAVVLSHVPLHTVEPATWKKHFRLAGKDKEASRQAVLALLPSTKSHLKLKKHHGRAEAILIAMYGADTMMIPNAAPPRLYTVTHVERRTDQDSAAHRA